MLSVSYEQAYDHTCFGSALDKMHLFDVTGYPYTVAPKSFKEDVIKHRNIEFSSQQVHLLAPKSILSADDFKFNLETYQENSHCPRKLDGFSNRLKIRISPLKINYIQELIMRLKDYFQEQFVDALTLSDPYQDPKKDFEDL